MGRARIHPAVDVLALFQQHPDIQQILRGAERQPGSVRNAGRRLLVVSAPGSLPWQPRQGLLSLPALCSSDQQRFRACFTRRAALFQGCAHMYDPLLLHGNKAGLWGWFSFSLFLFPSFIASFLSLCLPFSPLQFFPPHRWLCWLCP